MEARQQDTTLTGRFLTMHKRRRKKLTTRSLSTEQAPALLDDIHHGVVQVSGRKVFRSMEDDGPTSGGPRYKFQLLHTFKEKGKIVSMVMYSRVSTDVK